MTNPVKPEECSTMADVRHGIDALDARIVALIGERFRYIEAAARIKDHRDAVRDETRKAVVIEHATRVARDAGVPEGLVGQIYELLVEASIAHELDYFDRRQASASG
jgi:isochorismate pyruvate lyase